MAKSKLTTVDLFNGCGGFSLGAELAGCETLAAIDIDPNLQSAYRLNFPRANATIANVADMDATAWRLLLDKKRPDIVIGGPPCQGFSRMGKRVKSDPRNDLIGHFYRQILILKPKLFIMENVEGLLDEGNAEVLAKALDSVSGKYTIVGPLVINAADFGAATLRKRVVVIGYDRREFDDFTEDDIRAALVLKKTSVRDAIADLPSPVAGRGKGDDFGWAVYPDCDKRKLSAYAKRMRAAPPRHLGWKNAVANLERGEISGLFETLHTRDVIARFKKVKQGKPDVVSKCPKLSWEGLCPTLRAGTGSDKGSFQSIRPLHPDEPRVITVREAARLQGFPDWFVFHPTKWHSFRMIGNSVSPVVSSGLISWILSRVDATGLSE